MSAVIFIVIAATFCIRCTSVPGKPQPRSLEHASERPPASVEQKIPHTTLTLEMIHVPGDGEAIKAFYIAAAEVTWDLFDLFVYGDDAALLTEAGGDAIARPSKPYLPPDRGFGHEGYPAMSMSFHSAQRFCEWMSRRTGGNYRLPTEAEWTHACRLGSLGAPPLDDRAWHLGNANDTTHPAATKKADALGLFDMAGNVAEWCVDDDGKAIACGGSYLDDAAGLGCEARQRPSPGWNASDPQLPKSQWWLADCSFVGLRVVCDAQQEVMRHTISSRSDAQAQPDGDDSGQRP